MSLSFYQKLNFIISCITFGICIVGIAANVLVFCLFARRALRKYSYSFYNQIKACVDTYLLLVFMQNSCNALFGVNLNDTNVFLCVNAFYIRYSIMIASLALIVLISLDRHITVAYSTNDRSRILRKKWFQSILALGVLVYGCLMSVMFVLNPLYQDQRVDNTTVRKICRVPSDVGYRTSWIYVGNILGFILVINNIVNVRLIQYILASRKRVVTSSSGQTNQNRASKDRKFAIASIGISLTAFVCRLPVGIVLIVYIQAKLDLELSIFLISITTFMMTVECSSSFLINLSLNSTFYKEFLGVVLRTNLESQSRTLRILSNIH